MNKIEQLHLDSINSDNSHDFDVYANVEYTRDFNPNKAAVNSAEITEEIAIEFAEFVATYPNKNRNIHGDMLHAKSKYDGAETTKDLFQEFLNTKI